MKTFTYNDVYSDSKLFNYKKYYFDFLNKKISNNSSVIYIKNNKFQLGTTVFKDIEITVDDQKFILKGVPHIKTIKSELIQNDGTNCILI